MLLAVVARRTRSAAFTQAVAWTLAGILLANWAGTVYYEHAYGTLEPPMQLCDWAAFAVIVALLLRRKGFYEVAYFWGLSGTFQAVLTPNLAVRFPDYRFISFFIFHSGVVAGVLFLTLAMGFRPTWGSLPRAWAWSQVYLACALLVNHFTGNNFGFLSHKPTAHSLLDYLSDDKVLYILGMELFALAFFLILYAPFAIRDYRDYGLSRSIRHSPPGSSA